MEPLQVTVVIKLETVQTAARHFLRRYILRSSFFDLVWTLVFICIGTFLGITGNINRELAVGCIIAGLAFVVLIILVALKYVRLARSKFSEMTDPHVTYTFAEDTFGAKSCLGSMEMPWKAITEIWKYNDVWLLFFGSHGYSTFPVSLVALEVASFVEERVRANGGKVT